MNREGWLVIASWLEPGFLWYFTLINLVYFILMILGSFKFFSRYREAKVEDFSQILRSNSLPEISFVIPLFNKEKEIIKNILGIKNLSYRYKKIIIVNDGSTDSSFKKLEDHFHLLPIPKFYEDILSTKPVRGVYQSLIYPEIYVIDKENGKKNDAVNAGVNAVEHPFFIVLDADTVIDNRSFEALVRPILEHPNTIAVGAGIRILNGCSFDFNQISTLQFPSDYWTTMQSLEYLRAFLTRQGWDLLKNQFIISGAFGIFPRALIIKVGGFCPSVAEDMEIVIRLHRLMKETQTSYRITYLPDPVAWTEAPENYQELKKQRIQWHFGTLECLWYHKHLCFNPRYGFFGMVTFPFWVFGEAFEPWVELLAFFYLFMSFFFDTISFNFLILLAIVSFGLTAAATLFSLFVEELSFKKYPSWRTLLFLAAHSVIENFGYRQLTILWRIGGFYRFYKLFSKVKKDTEWVKTAMARARETGSLKGKLFDTLGLRRFY